MGAQLGVFDNCCTEGENENVCQIRDNTTNYAANSSGVRHDEYVGNYQIGGVASAAPPWETAVPVDSSRGNPFLQDGPTPRRDIQVLADPLHLADKAMQFDGPQGYVKAIAATRAKMRAPPNEKESTTDRNNVYGDTTSKRTTGLTQSYMTGTIKFPVLEKGRHVPTLALINPKSGAKAGQHVLSVARACPIWQDRFFSIIAVVEDTGRGGLMDVFRMELTAAKDEARAMGTRPRIVSGGGDGTGTFTLHMILRTLQADNSRSHEGLGDTGNGFIWTDEELKESFPALAQMPLGSANDFANILGWGQKYPGSANCCRATCAASSVFCNKKIKAQRFKQLVQWMEHVIDPASQVCNFDVWGIMPVGKEDKCNFKLAELGAKKGRNPKSKVDGKQQLTFKEASKPTPFFVMLYFSTGFGGYLCSRFSINRRSTPFANRLEYVRQAIGMIFEKTPPQTFVRTNGVRVDCAGPKGGDGDALQQAYFPPRRGRRGLFGFVKGSRYREVGFYNINWQAHALHGSDRAPLWRRICSSGRRRPVKFNDGLLDMYRMRFKSYFKNPGPNMQTDKRKDMTLTFEAAPGKGIFVQYDGEARFVFNPTGEQFNIFIRKVLNIPVVMGPGAKESLTGKLKDESAAFFEISGDTPELKQKAKSRLLKSLQGDLDQELNATIAEIAAAKLPVYTAPHDTVRDREAAPLSKPKTPWGFIPVTEPELLTRTMITPGKIST